MVGLGVARRPIPRVDGCWAFACVMLASLAPHSPRMGVLCCVAAPPPVPQVSLLRRTPSPVVWAPCGVRRESAVVWCGAEGVLCACVRVHICVHVRSCAHACMNACAHTCVRARAHECRMRTCTRVCACAHECVRDCVCSLCAPGAPPSKNGNQTYAGRGVAARHTH